MLKSYWKGTEEVKTPLWKREACQKKASLSTVRVGYELLLAGKPRWWRETPRVFLNSGSVPEDVQSTGLLAEELEAPGLRSRFPGLQFPLCGVVCTLWDKIFVEGFSFSTSSEFIIWRHTLTARFFWALSFKKRKKKIRRGEPLGSHKSVVAKGSMSHGGYGWRYPFTGRKTMAWASETLRLKFQLYC